MRDGADPRTVVTADTLAGEISTGTIQAVVAKPVRRVEIVLGKWLGFAALLALYLLFAIKVADQWEKAVVLRLGRFRGMRGPGPFLIVPVVDSSFTRSKIARRINRKSQSTSRTVR